MSDRQIRVMVVDDHPGVRALIKELLGSAANLSVIGEAENGLQAVELAATLKPDIILMDVELPALRGDLAMRQIRQSHPDVKVLGISSYSDPSYIKTMLDYGASGYITKEEVPDLLLRAIQGVFEDAESVWMSAQARRSIGLAYVEEQTLTRKETDILQLLLAGRSDLEIAMALSMDVKQLTRHLELLMHKFQAPSQEALKDVARRVLPPPLPPPPA